MKDIETAFGKCADEHPRIAVIGDVMLDEHVTVDVLGISPEDDLAWKLKVKDTRSRPGGAANVAMNLKALGADVLLIGAIGHDYPGDRLKAHIKDAGIKFHQTDYEHGRTTTVKRRYLTPRGKHICRVDNENTLSMKDECTKEMFGELFVFAPKMVVVSDYAKGVVTEELIGGLQAQNHPYIVDPKDKPFQWYGKALVLTPNEKEYRKIVCGGDEDVRDMYDCLRGLEPEHPGQGMLVKRGEHGAKLFSAQDTMWQFSEDFKVRAREVGDPAGCGDSLIAGLAYALSLGWPLFQACRLAVAAGACAYDHTGVYSVQREDLVKELRSFDY